MIFLVLLFIGAFLAHEYNDTINKDDLDTGQQYDLEISSGSIMSYYAYANYSLRVYSLMDALQLDLNDTDSFIYESLVDAMVTTAHIAKHFDQIRILDVIGKEIIRVKYQNVDDIKVTPASQLQFKGDRYFKDFMGLKDNKNYISPFDLNMEHVEIEIPLTPLLHLGSVITDDDNTKLGYLLYNISVLHPFDEIRNWEDEKRITFMDPKRASEGFFTDEAKL